MKKFIAVIKTEWKSTFTYPGMLIIWMFDLFVIPIIMLFVWLTVMKTQPLLINQRQQIINFYVLLPLVALLVSAWHGKFLAEKIRTGKLNTWLTKPLLPLWYYLANNLTEKATKLVFLLPLVAIATVGFGLHLSVSLPTLLLIAITLVLGTAINFGLSLAIGLTAFWLDEVDALENLYEASYFALGGRIIPLFLFSPQLKTVAQILPFRYFASFPLELLTTNLNAVEVVTGLILQLAWLIIVWFMARWLWQKGVKKYEGYGG